MSFLKNIPASNQSDSDLAALYKRSGDLQVLAELYQRYMELVYGVCLKYLAERESARDAVMQIFEELVVKLRRHEVVNFKSWLHQLAKNHCLMQLRTPKNVRTVEFDPALVQSSENVHLNGVFEKEENLARLEYCLTTLSIEQRDMIRLFYLEGKCYKEIVEITGAEWNQVRSFIQNGRRNLKNCMESPANQEAAAVSLAKTKPNEY